MQNFIPQKQSYFSSHHFAEDFLFALSSFTCFIIGFFVIYQNLLSDVIKFVTENPFFLGIFVVLYPLVAFLVNQVSLAISYSFFKPARKRWNQIIEWSNIQRIQCFVIKSFAGYYLSDTKFTNKIDDIYKNIFDENNSDKEFSILKVETIIDFLTFYNPSGRDRINRLGAMIVLFRSSVVFCSILLILSILRYSHNELSIMHPIVLLTILMIFLFRIKALVKNCSQKQMFFIISTKGIYDKLP